MALAGEYDPVRRARNTIDKSAEVCSELSERGNSAHVWTMNKLVDVGSLNVIGSHQLI